jgi:dihydroxy-acid dehydratase
LFFASVAEAVDCVHFAGRDLSRIGATSIPVGNENDTRDAMEEMTMLKGNLDKSKLPSRHVTEGPARAPHRSYFYAMGLSDEEIHQPFVGVATCWNEAAPCNIALSRQAQSVKLGVKHANGTPREFTTITVTDGIAMGHEGMRSSLASRDAITDTVELTMRGHCYDAIVGLAGCDKSLPGMMMAMVRLNVPSVFIYGGSILPGRLEGRDITVQDVFEAVGQHQAGNLSDEALAVIERVACPSAGRAAGSSPRTPWPVCPRRLALRCRTPRARLRLMKAGTSMASPPVRR